MKTIKLIFLFLFTITVQTYAMQNGTDYILAHASDNPNIVVLCNQQTVRLYNPVADTNTNIPATNNNAYHSVSTNNNIIAVQTTKGLNIYRQNCLQKTKKTWHQNLGTTCRNQIALFPDDDHTLVVHSIDKNASNITHAIEVHSIQLPGKITIFSESFSKLRPSSMQNDEPSPAKNVTIKPLIACHPCMRQVAFKLRNHELAIHNIIPHNYILMMCLLHYDLNKEDTLLNLLPIEIRKIIFKNIIDMCELQWITKYISLKGIENTWQTSQSYDLIEYSPNGLFIALLFCNHVATYNTSTGALSNVLSYSSPQNNYLASMAFYPLANHTLAVLSSDGTIYLCNIASNSHTCISTNNPIYETGKLMAFSQNGKEIHIARGSEYQNVVLPRKTARAIKRL